MFECFTFVCVCVCILRKSQLAAKIVPIFLHLSNSRSSSILCETSTREKFDAFKYVPSKCSKNKHRNPSNRVVKKYSSTKNITRSYRQHIYLSSRPEIRKRNVDKTLETTILIAKCFSFNLKVEFGYDAVHSTTHAMSRIFSIIH